MSFQDQMFAEDLAVSSPNQRVYVGIGDAVPQAIALGIIFIQNVIAIHTLVLGFGFNF
jgi:hypothetical protein